MDWKSNSALSRSYYLKDRFFAEDEPLRGGDFVVPERKTEEKERTNKTESENEGS